MRVFSLSSQLKRVHKEDRDMNASLQAWHTCVNVAIPSSLCKKSGTRVRISEGILLIGATLFFKD